MLECAEFITNVKFKCFISLKMRSKKVEQAIFQLENFLTWGFCIKGGVDLACERMHFWLRSSKNGGWVACNETVLFCSLHYLGGHEFHGWEIEQFLGYIKMQWIFSFMLGSFVEEGF